MTSKSEKQYTKAIHSGQEPDPLTGAIMPSIYMTSTYVQEAPGETKGYDYTRAGNPNFTQLEKLLAGLEGAKHATYFSSGLGATTALLSSLSSGDRVVALSGLYGGTYRLFTRVFQKFGIQFDVVDIDQLPDALQTKANMLYFETPTNPLLEIYDIAYACDLAKKAGVLSVVDNTFATPIFQNPLELGADAVLHSTTKYIGGHSDVIGGVIMTNRDELKEALDFGRMAIGVNPSPFDSWLTLRGAKTLAVRMAQHAKSAQMIATALSDHPEVKRVYYPGLSSHPQHEIAAKQMSGFSGMVSVEFERSLEATKKMIASYEVFALAESLGGVESLVCHPTTMTHASIPEAERRRIGLSDGLVRFSVGLESPEDLLNDIEKGLKG